MVSVSEFSSKHRKPSEQIFSLLVFGFTFSLIQNLNQEMIDFLPIASNELRGLVFKSDKTL